MRTKPTVRIGLGLVQDRSALEWPKLPNLIDFQTKLLKSYEKGMEKRACALVPDIMHRIVWTAIRHCCFRHATTVSGTEMYYYTEKMYILCTPVLDQSVRNRRLRPPLWSRDKDRTFRFGPSCGRERSVQTFPTSTPKPLVYTVQFEMS